MKHFYIFFSLFTFCLFGQVNPPAELQDYYQEVDFSQSGDQLYNDLATTTIAKHTTFLTYSQRHQYLYEADEDPSNSSNVLLIYSGESRDKDEFLSGNNTYNPQTFNTEHLYPRSLVDNTAEADLHHLRPCDISVNSDRGNLAFADGSGAYGLVAGGWYPGDDWRGDVARSIMYMNLRYNESFDSVGDLNLFLEWNAEDPVSAIEIQRNDVIFDAQGNRNPFIDNPYLASLIWAGPTAENRWSTLSVRDLGSKEDFKMYPNPTRGSNFRITTPDNAEVFIYNVLAKLVKTATVSTSQNEIDIRSLEKGVYLVKIKTKNKTATRKLIIK